MKQPNENSCVPVNTVYSIFSLYALAVSHSHASALARFRVGHSIVSLGFTRPGFDLIHTISSWINAVRATTHIYDLLFTFELSLDELESISDLTHRRINVVSPKLRLHGVANRKLILLRAKWRQICFKKSARKKSWQR